MPLRVEAGATGYSAALQVRHSSFRPRCCIVFASLLTEVNHYSTSSKTCLYAVCPSFFLFG